MTTPNPTPNQSNEPRRETPPDMLAAALDYARQGIRVFPLYGIRDDGTCECYGGAGCTQSGKHPRTKHGLSDATTSELVIRKWFTEWPMSNIGGRTGSRLVGADADSEDGLAELMKYGVDPDTIHATSRPGHRIHYFKPPPGVVLSNQQKKVGSWPLEYCDARGEGGYVILPPSRHYTGSRYTLSKPLDIGALPTIPENLLRVWKPKASDPRAEIVTWDESDGCWVEEVEELDDNSAEGFTTADYFLHSYTKQALQGADRNPTGFLLACQLRDAGLTYESALTFMRRYQRVVETIKPDAKDYDWREAEQSLKQAYTRPKRKPVSDTSEQPKQQKVVAFNWREHVQSAATLRDKEIVVKPFLVEGIIPHGFTELGARPKSGKSLLGLQLALAVASENGSLFARAVRHGRVLYLALEDPDRRIQTRIEAMLEIDYADHFRRDPWPERLDVAYEWPKWPQGGLEHLDSYLEAYPETVLVVMDTMTDFRGPVPRGGGYDIDYDYSRALSAWVNRHDIALLGITHTGKRKPADDPESFSLDMIQNTTGITAGADTVLVMARDAGVMTLYRSGRDLDDTSPLKLKRDEEGMRWNVDETQKMMTAAEAVLFALENANRPQKPSAMAALTGHSANAIRVACSRLLEEKPPKIGVLNGMYYLTARGPDNVPPKAVPQPQPKKGGTSGGD